jgi:hypothetical protein
MGELPAPQPTQEKKKIAPKEIYKSLFSLANL